MTGLGLDQMMLDSLVARFVDIGIAQYDALLDDDTKGFNRLFDEMAALEDALKARPGDQRRALVPLYRHENLQVRLNAAKATLVVAPQAARQALEAIRSTHRNPQAADAAGCLRSLDDGFFKPT